VRRGVRREQRSERRSEKGVRRELHNRGERRGVRRQFHKRASDIHRRVKYARCLDLVSYSVRAAPVVAEQVRTIYVYVYGPQT